MEDLRREGYRYAPGSKDLIKKTHPSLVPWPDLAEDEKEKDRSTTRVIPKLLAMGGLQVYRAQASKHESPLVPPIDDAQA
jgi:hypothetical protein